MRRVCLTLLFLIWPGAAWAQNCCMPKLAEDDPSARLIEGVQWATAILLAAPALLVGGGIWWVRGLASEGPSGLASENEVLGPKGDPAEVGFGPAQPVEEPRKEEEIMGS